MGESSNPPQPPEAHSLHGEDATGPDLDELLGAIAASDVLVVGFPFCDSRLLFDLRGDELTGPLIELVEPLRSATERAAWLADRRPALGPPDSSSFVYWPFSTGYLAGSRAIEAVVDRVRREQGLDVTLDVRAALLEVASLERECTTRAIAGGEEFETLWSREEPA